MRGVQQGTSGRRSKQAQSRVGSEVAAKKEKDVAKLIKELRNDPDRKRQAIVRLCYEAGLVCGTAGVPTEKFDAQVGEVLTRNQHNVAIAAQQLLQFCLDSSSAAADELTKSSWPEQEATDGLPWPSMMRKMAAMHRENVLNSEIDSVKAVIIALWHGHQDDENVDMEVELYRYLRRKHDGNKERMANEAVGLIESMDRLEKDDMDIKIFSRIIRNHIDQGFWKVRTKLKQTIHDLAVNQGKTPEQIIYHMYNRTDSAVLLEEFEKGKRTLEDILLQFHLDRHEKLIAPIRAMYRKQPEEFRTKNSFSSYVKQKLLNAQQ